MIFNLDIVMKNTTVVLDSNYPEDATVTAGEDVTFKAVITDEGHPKEYTLQWYVDGTAVPDATGETYTRSTSSDKGVLSVWCEATNKAGTTTSRRATLTVKKAPSLDATYPKDATVNVGTDVTFEAKVAETGYPDAHTYQWYKNGTKVEGATNSSYSFYRSLEGSDTVYCEVTNVAGTVKTRTATLKANRIYLYNHGDQRSAITGGWVAAKYYPGAGHYENGFEIRSDGVMVIYGKPSERIGGCGTAWQIDFSKQTKLSTEIDLDVSTGNTVMCTATNLINFADYSHGGVVIPAGYNTVSLDISKVSQGHVCISSDVYTAGIRKVWLG